MEMETRKIYKKTGLWSFQIMLGLFCLFFTVGASQASAPLFDVIYSETFDFPPPDSGRFGNPENIDWIGESKGQLLVPNMEISIFDESSGPFLFWSPKTHDINLYTTQIGLLSVPVSSLKKVIWKSKNSVDTTVSNCSEVAGLLAKNKMRVAILVDTTWFISDATFNTTGAFSFATDRCDAVAFEEHTHDVNSGETYRVYSIGVGGAGRVFGASGALPTSGLVKAVGIFLDGAETGKTDIAGNIRIDDFTVEADDILSNAKDISHDGCINFTDLGVITSPACFTKTAPYFPAVCENADVNEDGIINILDLSAVISDGGFTPGFGDSCLSPQ